MPSTQPSLTYHLIFSTRNREPLLDAAWRPRLFDYLGGCFANLVRYIRNQEEHHRTRTFEDEYRAFLEKYEIELDERYLW